MKTRENSRNSNIEKKKNIENEYFERKKRKNSFKIELINTFGDQKKSPRIPFIKPSEVDDF
jgi:hypothetical protein